MKKEKVFYEEIAYVVGIILLAFGTALMERADFGISMVVAPAYLLHLKISEFLTFFSFGMASYIYQAVLLIILSIIMKKIKKLYFLSFATAFIYGLVLDGMISLVSLFNFEGIVWRIVLYVFGLVICAIGIAFFFHTYFPPEAYDLFVKELSEKTKTPIGKLKTTYDFSSCALSIIMSLCMFGGFVGVKWGTVICALLNGLLIGTFSKILDSTFTFKDGLQLRNKFN